MKYEERETATISLERYDDLRTTEQYYKKLRVKEFKLQSDLQYLLLSLFDKVDELYTPNDIEKLEADVTAIGLSVKIINENSNYIVYGHGEIEIDLTTLKRKKCN
jgi:hypothetical protein